jgi:hypothetical protein
MFNDGLMECQEVPPSEITLHRIDFHLFSMITSSGGIRRHWRESGLEHAIQFRPGVTSIFSPCDLYTNWSGSITR